MFSLLTGPRFGVWAALWGFHRVSLQPTPTVPNQRWPNNQSSHEYSPGLFLKDAFSENPRGPEGTQGQLWFLFRSTGCAAGHQWPGNKRVLCPLPPPSNRTNWEALPSCHMAPYCRAKQEIHFFETVLCKCATPLGRGYMSNANY